MKSTRINNVIGFIKKAPKAGRTYTDMLKFVADTELGVSYERSMDRGLIAHCMPAIRSVTKKMDDRYVFVG